MEKRSPEEKEVQFLYHKHNAKAKYPLPIEPIVFPAYISKILNKKTKRTAVEKKKLEQFRKRALYELQTKSWKMEYEEKLETEARNREIQEKIKQTKDRNNAQNPNKVKHFGIWLNQGEHLQISRENYAVIDEKTKEKKGFTDDWCNQHREACLQNFDLNMQYFLTLDQDDFNRKLSSFLKRRKRFKEIHDLDELKNIMGIYILVLDKYKQVYIGKSSSCMKKRIMSHWNHKKAFERLIFGKTEESVLSIDSFGALDTTRIFAMQASKWEVDKLEETYIAKYNEKYTLNRCAGGLNDGSCPFPELLIMATMKKRKLC